MYLPIIPQEPDAYIQAFTQSLVAIESHMCKHLWKYIHACNICQYKQFHKRISINAWMWSILPKYRISKEIHRETKWFQPTIHGDYTSIHRWIYINVYLHQHKYYCIYIQSKTSTHAIHAVHGIQWRIHWESIRN